jgi:hypothetical protein
MVVSAISITSTIGTTLLVDRIPWGFLRQTQPVLCDRPGGSVAGRSWLERSLPLCVFARHFSSERAKGPLISSHPWQCHLSKSFIVWKILLAYYSAAAALITPIRPYADTPIRSSSLVAAPLRYVLASLREIFMVLCVSACNLSGPRQPTMKFKPTALSRVELAACNETDQVWSPTIPSTVTPPHD